MVDGVPLLRIYIAKGMVALLSLKRWVFSDMDGKMEAACVSFDENVDIWKFGSRLSI